MLDLTLSGFTCLQTKPEQHYQLGTPDFEVLIWRKMSKKKNQPEVRGGNDIFPHSTCQNQGFIPNSGYQLTTLNPHT